MWDNITPQPNYWVHRAYAELDSNRIICNSTHIKTVALASKNNSNQEMKILIGRYENPNLGSHNASANVEVKITNFPYCSNCTIPLVIQQIPSNNVNYSIPLNSLITTFNGNITFAGDSSSVFLNGFIDGDSYTIYLNPSKGSILTVNEQLKSNSKSFEIYPNPSSSILHVSTISNKEMQFQIFNALGILVKEVTIYLTTQIDISNFANGVYFISVKNQPNQTQKFIKQ